MTLIVKRGSLPKTPHTEFIYKGNFTLEEIHGSQGFSGPFSRKVHLKSYPTEQVKAPRKANFGFAPKPYDVSALLQPHLVQTKDMPVGGDALTGRKCMVYGLNTKVSILKPNASFPEKTFFRNTEHYECFYFQDGEGEFKSEYGTIPFRKETYLVVPKGTTYRIDLKSSSLYALVIESKFPIEWPPHYMNHGGQAHLTSPVIETEIELPELPEPIDERGDFPIFVQHAGGKVTEITLGHHPFCLVGWEGALYPFLFDINNHHGIAREIHTAPPVHQTFHSGLIPHMGFSLCSFVPQMEGWHEKEIPAPYAHYNVDSDEVMFFCNTSYGAREGVLKEGSFTFHPGGMPHSPHGGAAERSTKARGKMSKRLAVMLDTYFESLTLTDFAYKFAEKKYAESWSEKDNE